MTLLLTFETFDRLPLPCSLHRFVCAVPRKVALLVALKAHQLPLFWGVDRFIGAIPSEMTLLVALATDQWPLLPGT